ncbi:hypothetical protein CDL62_12795 [Alkalitalea saponilacus]|nr:hypothetical protein CDL62_12795 [Alkalitalea saponilacus]
MAGLAVIGVSCNDDDDDVILIDENDYDPENLIHGTWVGIYNETFIGPDDKEATILYLKFNDQECTIISLTEEQQVAGLHGPYTYYQNDSELIIDIHQEWDSQTELWRGSRESFSVYLTAEIKNEHTLVIENDEVNQTHTLQRTVLRNPEHLSGEWNSEMGKLSLAENGTFQMHIPGEITTGIIQTMSYKNKNYLLINIQVSMKYGPSDYYAIYEYNKSDDTFTIKFPEGDVVFTKEDTNGDHDVEFDLTGDWLIISEHFILGPGDKDCNMIFLQIKEEDYLLFSFLDSDPVAGHKGPYETSGQDRLTITIQHDWDSNSYSWNHITDNVKHGMPVSLSEDGKTLTLRPGSDDIMMQKVNMKDFPAAEGSWYIQDGEDIISTLNVDNGYIVWEQYGSKQEGYIYDLGDLNGESYFLFHAVYCEFYPNEENPARDNADYFTLSRYTIDDHTFTLWHGDYKFELSKQ